jgi:hypothetical protein
MSKRASASSCVRAPVVSGFLGLSGVEGGRTFFDPVNRGDIRVIQRAEDLRFTAESRETIWIGRECLRQNLERDLATQPEIPGAIHLTHPARSERTHNLVGTELRAGADHS